MKTAPHLICSLLFLGPWLAARLSAAESLELPSGGHGLNGGKGPMWDGWQNGALKWLASLAFIPAEKNR